MVMILNENPLIISNKTEEGKYHPSTLHLTSCTNSRIPEPFITHEALPAADDDLEIGERPWFLEERRFRG